MQAFTHQIPIKIRQQVCRRNNDGIKLSRKEFAQQFPINISENAVYTIGKLLSEPRPIKGCQESIANVKDSIQTVSKQLSKSIPIQFINNAVEYPGNDPGPLHTGRTEGIVNPIVHACDDHIQPIGNIRADFLKLTRFKSFFDVFKQVFDGFGK